MLTGPSSASVSAATTPSERVDRLRSTIPFQPCTTSRRARKRARRPDCDVDAGGGGLPARPTLYTVRSSPSRCGHAGTRSRTGANDNCAGDRHSARTRLGPTQHAVARIKAWLSALTGDGDDGRDRCHCLGAECPWLAPSARRQRGSRGTASRGASRLPSQAEGSGAAVGRGVACASSWWAGPSD